MVFMSLGVDGIGFLPRLGPILGCGIVPPYHRIVRLQHGVWTVDA